MVIERDDGSIRNIWIFILPLGREQNFNIEQTYSSMKQRFANLFIFSKFEILLNFFLEKRRKINLDIYIYIIIVYEFMLKKFEDNFQWTS